MNNKFINQDDIIAVVGVSNDPQKYGYKVFFDLFEKGYKVFPIHPDNGEINGIKRYRSLKELPKKVTLVSIVVPPEVTKKIIAECKELGINKIWMQPGSEDEKAIKYCNDNNIEVLSNACIIVETKNKEG